MSDARTVWHELQTRRDVAARRQRSGVGLAIALLLVMTAAEVLFLTYVASPETANLVAGAEGIPTGGE